MTSADVTFDSATPVVPVDDLQAARAFYCDVLGFTFAFDQGDYVGVRRNAVEIHLNGYARESAGSAVLRVNTSGIDALYASLAGKGGVDIEEPLETKPWGMRQFTMHDSAGNHVTFAEPT